MTAIGRLKSPRTRDRVTWASHVIMRARPAGKFPGFDCKVAAGATNRSRIIIVVSRKIVHTAVLRNLIRRRFREAFRQALTTCPSEQPRDLVVFVRSPAIAEMQFVELIEHLTAALTARTQRRTSPPRAL